MTGRRSLLGEIYVIACLTLGVVALFHSIGA
jgi:hypothetical protein